MKRIFRLLLVLLLVVFVPSFVRASGVAALGDIACGIYTNTATLGISCMTNE